MDLGKVQVLISYLEVLQRGRSKPSTNGGGDIRESLHNIPDIDGVKKEINKELGIDVSNFVSEFKKYKHEK